MYTFFTVVGILLPDSRFGAYACDEEAYDVYQPLFDALVAACRHNSGQTTSVKTNCEKMNGQRKPCLEYIISSRVRMARNISGFKFSNTISKTVSIQPTFPVLEVVVVAEWSDHRLVAAGSPGGSMVRSFRDHHHLSRITHPDHCVIKICWRQIETSQSFHPQFQSE